MNRPGLNLPFNFAQQYPYNAYTMNTRQALASLGFDMDAFEVADCYGKRFGRATSGVPGNQATATAAAAAQYPRSYGIGTPLMDPFTMQYMWNPAINSSMFGVYDNSSNTLAREYYNQVMNGLAPTVSGNGASIGDGIAQSSNVQPVNLQQYIAATALLNGAANFRTDGSGDGPNGH
ncbi:unnamed protein product [Cercopithifilaria johnstoni]|uniref:Uncharacterized protein n=1 Tax=Cercopithifilaria johnstoni TaxID=2874296 RepID=A0A8J2LQ49_9BILA|nr:unnamed protein product [Cercopithifilaria johnstoni]